MADIKDYRDHSQDEESDGLVSGGSVQWREREKRQRPSPWCEGSVVARVISLAFIALSILLLVAAVLPLNLDVRCEEHMNGWSVYFTS